MEDLPFREHTFELNAGDSLFVYTDGVAEATNSDNELFGTDRMLDALNANPDAAPKEVLANMMDSINRFVAGAQQFDDITMLCFRYLGPGSSDSQ
jgi:sigma-B regulation protein RsbU (phosphoserine phosphatase)